MNSVFGDGRHDVYQVASTSGLSILVLLHKCYFCTLVTGASKIIVYPSHDQVCVVCNLKGLMCRGNMLAFGTCTQCNVHVHVKVFVSCVASTQIIKSIFFKAK